MEPRRRAERALVAVVAEAFRARVSTRRAEDLAQTLGVQRLRSSQASELARSLDEQVAAFGARPLDACPYPCVWVDALAIRGRDDHRIVNVCVVLATAVNAHGHHEIVGVDLVTSEDGAGWTASCAAWSPAACPTCSWSPPTPTRASRPRSPRCCPVTAPSPSLPRLGRGGRLQQRHRPRPRGREPVLQQRLGAARRRRHSTLDYASPVSYEQQQASPVPAA